MEPKFFASFHTIMSASPSASSFEDVGTIMAHLVNKSTNTTIALPSIKSILIQPVRLMPRYLDALANIAGPHIFCNLIAHTMPRVLAFDRFDGFVTSKMATLGIIVVHFHYFMPYGLVLRYVDFTIFPEQAIFVYCPGRTITYASVTHL
ncbi:conserved hypothetical protein [Histoplasma mississippiense (nom. inval.)]|uniref:conserved hypothetical protein n=1 Tax=Ajellomyces capsulatus (strain NAm1 / WU24) TaxID=2059318 RepID=UPI000157CB51|nr:conserved hypothetical protein [Histoplasma mississippiense (nom. inval.)]EDN10243.1 conserved hypothetical protein [Histoplasma mississippiense (nom. inval.)]